MAHPDVIQELLKENGFQFETLDDSDGELEALYIKAKAGGASIYVTIPINCDNISDDVLIKDMETARSPQTEYAHLLTS